MEMDILILLLVPITMIMVKWMRAGRMLFMVVIRDYQIFLIGQPKEIRRVLFMVTVFQVLVM